LLIACPFYQSFQDVSTKKILTGFIRTNMLNISVKKQACK